MTMGANSPAGEPLSPGKEGRLPVALEVHIETVGVALAIGHEGGRGVTGPEARTGSVAVAGSSAK